MLDLASQDFDLDPDELFVDQEESRSVNANVAHSDFAERAHRMALLQGTVTVGLIIWMMDNDFSWVLDLYRSAGGGL
jgi:hypothetical protein